MLQKNDKKLINAWASFDWANSVYNLIITTAIFPVYFLGTTEDFFKGEELLFFGMNISNSVLYSYAISFSFLIIVFISPILSGIADYSGKKKRFMKFFTYLGSFACMGLYFFTGENVEYGILCAVLGSVGFAGSLVFYNSFLPEVATVDKMDSVSAKGFSLGYIGSVILLIVNLVLFQSYESFGFESGLLATRFGFILVGVWWLGFAQIAFYYLKDKETTNSISKEILGKGKEQILQVLKKVKTMPSMNFYLVSFFIFSMGVQTVMLLAPLFANKVIGMESDEMILVVLIIQIVAIGGSYFFAWLSRKKGNGTSISTALIIWGIICVAGYFLNSKIPFYVMAMFLGFVMGGIQSISRSTYSKLIPKDTSNHASFFSFYDITEKLGIVIGTFSYGLIDQITGSMRISMLCMTLFFITGFVILQKAKLNALNN
ncbi:MFS transporter [Flavicella sp.]|uniref:MFS transporter n=1 Tax=Flavicella sp. TaxID=2957742 RepID=UPI002630ED63|nr:MFS transporter [Flavicella sp.]MDG1804961.1 MFS transporter [Flavicella sp.]